MNWVVTFYESPNQTGRNVHIFTWADDAEHATIFATRQVEALAGSSVGWHPAEPQRVGELAVG